MSDEIKNTNEGQDPVSEEDRAKAKKAGCILFAVAAFVFAVILFAEDLIENHFGKVASTVMLCIIAAIVATYLFKDNIKAFFVKILGKK